MTEAINNCPFDEDIARGIFEKQSKQIKQLKAENEELKKGWYKSTKCHHLVLDECSLTGKTCKGLQECFKQAEKELKENREELEELRQVRKNMPDIQEPYVILYRQIKKECTELEKKLKYEEEMNIDIAEESVNVNGNLKQKLENIEEAVSESIAVNEFATPLAKIILQILKEE